MVLKAYCKSTKFDCYKILWIYYVLSDNRGFPYIILFNFVPMLNKYAMSSDFDNMLEHKNLSLYMLNRKKFNSLVVTLVHIASQQQEVSSM